MIVSLKFRDPKAAQATDSPGCRYLLMNKNGTGTTHSGYDNQRVWEQRLIWLMNENGIPGIGQRDWEPLVLTQPEG